MDNAEIEAILKETFEEGEHVKWRGQSAPYKLLDSDNKKSTLTFWLIAIVIAAAASLGYTFFALSSGAQYQPFVLIFTIGFPILAFVDPIRDRTHIIKQVLIITNLRVFVLHKNSGVERKSLGLRLSEIDIARIEDLETGFSRIRFGSETFQAKDLKLRRKAMMGALDNADKVVGLVFYHISNNDRDAICAILNEESVTIEKTT